MAFDTALARGILSVVWAKETCMKPATMGWVVRAGTAGMIAAMVVWAGAACGQAWGQDAAGWVRGDTLLAEKTPREKGPTQADPARERAKESLKIAKDCYLDPSVGPYALANAAPCWVVRWVALVKPDPPLLIFVGPGAGGGPSHIGVEHTRLVLRESDVKVVLERIDRERKRPASGQNGLPDPVVDKHVSVKAATAAMCTRRWPTIPGAVYDGKLRPRPEQSPVRVVSARVPILVEVPASELAEARKSSAWQDAGVKAWNKVGGVGQLPAPREKVTGGRAPASGADLDDALAARSQLAGNGVILPGQPGLYLWLRQPEEVLAVRFLVRQISPRELLVPWVAVAGAQAANRSDVKKAIQAVTGRGPILMADGMIHQQFLVDMGRGKDTLTDGKWHAVEIRCPGPEAKDGLGQNGRVWIDGKLVLQNLTWCRKDQTEKAFEMPIQGGPVLLADWQTNAVILDCEQVPAEKREAALKAPKGENKK